MLIVINMHEVSILKDLLSNSNALRYLGSVLNFSKNSVRQDMKDVPDSIEVL